MAAWNEATTKLTSDTYIEKIQRFVLWIERIHGFYLVVVCGFVGAVIGDHLSVKKIQNECHAWFPKDKSFGRIPFETFQEEEYLE